MLKLVLKYVPVILVNISLQHHQKPVLLVQTGNTRMNKDSKDHRVLKNAVQENGLIKLDLFLMLSVLHVSVDVTPFLVKQKYPLTSVLRVHRDVIPLLEKDKYLVRLNARINVVSVNFQMKLVLRQTTIANCAVQENGPTKKGLFPMTNVHFAVPVNIRPKKDEFRSKIAKNGKYKLICF